MRAKESLNRNLMWLSEQLLEAVRNVKEARKNFILIFFITKQANNLKTICACQKSTDLISKGFKKNIQLVT